MIHELVDREDPRCLYCKSDVDIRLDEANRTSGFQIHNVEILKCRKCNEVFEIYQWDDCEPDSFLFTCFDIAVLYIYTGKDMGFHIGSKKDVWPNFIQRDGSITVPPFPVKFSDKNKLYEKLKTYRVFS